MTVRNAAGRTFWSRLHDRFGDTSGQNQVVSPGEFTDAKETEITPEEEQTKSLYHFKLGTVPDLLGWISRFRKNRVRVYGYALILVIGATLVRLGLHQQLSGASPFAVYSLPVLCMALAGGFYPGMVTLAASVVAGSIMFLPPALSFSLAEGAGWPLLVFVAVGGIEVVLVSGLIAVILLHSAHQRLLSGELRHRSRNLFAVLQGIVSRTLMESQSLAGAQRSLEMRLASLARTHAMMADSGWMGAPLDKILAEELTSFVNQVTCTGCDLPLNTAGAQTFALIIHELATNAVKHGALSRPEGRLTIQGRMQSGEGADLFRFTWTETGGPLLKRPQRRGFGSSILNGMAKRFAEHLEVTYRPEGLVYELDVLVASVRASVPRTTTKGEWQAGHLMKPFRAAPICINSP